MKNKEDSPKAKSDEFLAFEALAKRLITTKKEENPEKVVNNSDSAKPFRKKTYQKSREKIVRNRE